MPAQSPRGPSPADLARVRPAPGPPRSAPPTRARRLAEIEKERARRALRALLADPATDLSALDADGFFAALRCACQDGPVTAALVAEVARRLARGTAASRDLHQVLLVAGDDDRWTPARGAAMAVVAGRPHLAVEVLGLEAQRLGTPPMRVDESAGEAGFTVRASLDRDGVTVAGQPCLDTSKKRASQGAAVSLLAELTGIPVPAVTGSVAGQTRNSGSGAGSSPGLGLPPAPTVARSDASSTSVRADPTPAPGVSPAELEAWLDHVVSRPTPDPGLAELCTPGRLTARSLFLLLFEADPRGWRHLRAVAWSALVSTPSQSPGVLSMHTQARSWAPASYVEPDDRTAIAYVITPDGPVVGEPAVAAGIRAARVSAALALVRDLAPPVQGDEVPDAPAPGGGPVGGFNPVGLLNEHAQRGVIADLTYEHESTGPAHRPVFTCTARCVHTADPRSASAEATSKGEAKAAAAAALLEQVLAAERTHLVRLARARREQARSPAGIFARLVRGGCPVDFTGHELRIGGHLPEPLAGWELTVLSALPILATLDGPVHPSTRFWASAARAALEAVAARRVYPALDAEGRDCWRLAPVDGFAPATTPCPGVTGPGVTGPGVTGFLDAVAEALVRSGGARLVVGDLPYAARSRRLDGEAAEWADRVADAAEGATARPLVIRLDPPAEEGAPLRAQVRAVPAGRAHPAGAADREDDAGCPDGAACSEGVACSHGEPPGAGLVARAEERLLRRAVRDWPPLGRVRREGTLSGAQAAELLGPAGERLASLGITVEWPAHLVTASGLGRQVVVGSGGSGPTGAFSLTDVAELSWQFSLDGEPLTPEEAEAAAAAVEGVIRIRGRWVVVDAETRRLASDRHAGRLSGIQALGAALTGQVRVGGRDVACAGAGRLAELLATLRGAGPEPDDDAVVDGLDATLRGYQRVGVRWLARTTSAGFGALLADDMGLGKTLTVIAFRLSRQNPGPSLVVCPASLVVNWEREFARFAPGVTVRRYHSTGRSLEGLRSGEVVVTTYGTLLRDAAVLAEVPWDLVVADEAQQVKNHRSQAARALRLLRPAARVAVTGTPVENSLTELWAILDWTNPGLLGSLPVFRERFARAVEQEAAQGVADRDAAQRLSRLIAPFVLRRRKSDPHVAPELPDKVVNNRYLELSREQVGLYRAATDQALGRIAASQGLERRGQVLRLFQSLRQICNAPAHYLRESPQGWDPDAQAARSGKLGVLEELMESVILNGDAALIFTGYVSMGHLICAHLAARGIRAEFLHGGVPVGARQEIVDRFQSGDGDALVLSVRAAGTGLNLTRAGHVIHFDRQWNPAVEDQATDRAHRIGQHRLVEVHHLITEGTVEDRIAGLLARKRELTDTVLGGGQTALTELSDSELSALVSLGADLDPTDPRTGDTE